METKSYRLYNGQWDKDMIFREKYERIRKVILSSFDNLEFEEGPHKYYLNQENGKRVELPCVSNITHIFKPKFETDIVAQKTYDKYYNDPDSKYFGMTVEQIKEAWVENSRRACEHGTERHEFAESCFYYMTYQYEKILPNYQDRLKKDDDGRFYLEAVYPKEIAAAKFYEDVAKVGCVIPILAETKVYVCRDKYRYAGTFDLLMYYDQSLDPARKNQKEDHSGLMVCDWKSNKDLYKQGSSNLLYQFDDFIDMPLNIYKLQLSAYQIALESIKLKVVARRIMWLLPDDTYKKINLEDLTRELNIGLECHFDKLEEH